MAEEEAVSPSQESYLASLAYEIFTSPLNLFLLGVCAVLIYKILRPSDGSGAGEVHEGLFSPPQVILGLCSSPQQHWQAAVLAAAPSRDSHDQHCQGLGPRAGAWQPLGSSPS